MSCDDFEKLDFADKAEYLVQKGQLIGSRFYNDNLFLFIVNTFFVEVSLNNSENHFERIEIVNYDTIQEHYLHVIDINDVFN